MSDSERIRSELSTALDGIRRQNPELPADVLLSWPVATSQYVEQTLGKVTVFSQLAEKTCRRSALWVVSGISRTGSNGTATVSLSTYHCRLEQNSYERPAIVQVTPQPPTPAVLTAKAEVDSAADDVVITVFSWDGNGQALPNVWFYWTCTVATVDEVG